MNRLIYDPQIHTPWNKGKLVGQKPPLKLKEIWAIRIRLQISTRIRDLALFNLAIDSKLRSCDLVKIRVRDISVSGHSNPKRLRHPSAISGPPENCCSLVSDSYYR